MSEQAPKRVEAIFRASPARYRHARRAAALLAFLGLAACTGRGGTIPYDVKDFGPPDAPATLTVAEDYKIAAQDTVAVSVFGVNEFSGDFVIDPLGRLRMPLIGDIQAQGLTADQLTKQVQQKLASSYLRDPKVQVAVKEAKGRKITIEGSVNQPGIYPIGGDTTLLQMIATAHGTTDDANPSRVVVFRTINGERMAAAFDVKDIERGRMADPPMYQNDVIVVDGSRSRKLFRDSLMSIPVLGLFITRF